MLECSSHQVFDWQMLCCLL